MAQQEDQERTAGAALTEAKMEGYLEKLAEKGWDASMTEASPNSIASEISGKQFDLIACVSPVRQDFGIPKVKAVGMLTGMAEDKVVEDCLAILEAKG